MQKVRNLKKIFFDIIYIEKGATCGRLTCVTTSFVTNSREDYDMNFFLKREEVGV